MSLNLYTNIASNQIVRQDWQLLTFNCQILIQDFIMCTYNLVLSQALNEHGVSLHFSISLCNLIYFGSVAKS